MPIPKISVFLYTDHAAVLKRRRGNLKFPVCCHGNHKYESFIVVLHYILRSYYKYLHFSLLISQYIIADSK